MYLADVKQLSRDLRHLTSQLQGNSSLGTPLPRPPSTGSASSVTGLKVNGSTKKPLGVKQQKLEDPGEGNQEGEEDEDLEHAVSVHIATCGPFNTYVFILCL